ncbi:BREX-1 system adenine-specific DNA-methyltransferase PglX, partial [Phocaeicola plebeius]|uniref:BREX-1 system adenine-specific DNA-methyltransferase PglX n=1 Tax=Phocaeicola plebeius TaxID=310297 RepID=UPI0026EBC6D5
ILNVPEYNWALLRRFVDGIDMEGQISFDDTGVEKTAKELKTLIDLGETMARKYWITVTNPPYMGGGGMDNKLSDYVRKNYIDSKSDLFSVCMERGNQMTRANGFNCMVTMQSWMFLSSFENVRVKLLQTKTITTLMHMDNMVMGIAFGTAATSFRNTKIDNYKGTYTYIKYCDIENDKPKVFPELNNRFAQVSVERYSGILGTPVAYWVSDSILEDFHSKDNIGNIAPPKQGLATADNERFLRLWHEISVQKIGFGYSSCEEAADSKKKYFPYNKGGSFRRWYGNRDYVVDWENDGYEIKNIKDSNGKVRSRPQNLQYYFKPAITWSDVTSGSFSGRYVEQGFMFDIKGSSGFPNVKLLPYVIGLLNSKIAQVFIKILNPTVTTQVGDMTRIPVVKGRVEEVIRFANECVEYAKNDWDSFETSWNFKIHPLVKLKMAGAYAWGDNEPAMRIESAYKAWKETCNGRFEKLKANEEELNRIFIDIYGLQDELTPEVEEKDVTVRKADLQRDIKSLLSYAVGCMFGRYSIYKDGLLFAGEPYSLQAFVDKLNDRPETVSAEELERAYRNEGVVVDEMFFPDKDNVIPITDEEYLDDDIVARLCDWLKAVYGAATLEANLDYIAKALGNKGSTSREVIRNYFVNDFFKDHCQTYSVT